MPTRAPRLSGVGAALLTVLILAAYPVATRAALSASATPESLVLLRFGVGALCFAPYLLLRLHKLPPGLWRAGLPLAFCQGAGMAALVIFGLQYAPASHSAALGPGTIHVWVALIGVFLFARTPGARYVAGCVVTVCGIALLIFGGAKWNATVLLGDAMFLAASALGALYVLQLRDSGIACFHGALVVTVYSALVIVPLYLVFGNWAVAGMPALELLWQALWQGVLIGFVALLAMNHAIARLGGERACALFAMVPALSAILGAIFLGESPAAAEWAGIFGISLGVAVAAMPPRASPAYSA